jgi:hypothetical protein
VKCDVAASASVYETVVPDRLADATLAPSPRAGEKLAGSRRSCFSAGTLAALAGAASTANPTAINTKYLVTEPPQRVDFSVVTAHGL